MFGVGQTEIILVALVFLLLFGPKALPKLARSVGDVIRELRGISKEIEGAREDVQ